MNPNLFPFEYLSLTQLGKVFDTDAYTIGRRLAALGLRSASGQPHPKAVEAGLAKRVTEHGGDPFWAWHRQKVVLALQTAGHGQVATSDREQATDCDDPVALQGPFTCQSGGDADNWEIVDANGIVGIWVHGGRVARKLRGLLNLAHDHGKW